jgi:dethiobiotin synthetase
MSKPNQFFVTGIGTDVGKTVVSAILVEALKADYWKPIQSGMEPSTDSSKIKNWAPNHGQIHPETYLLKTPVSPHLAAKIEGVEITLDNIELPSLENDLIVEGAGGILVPINASQTMLDLMLKLALPVVLVSRHYLGSINHTLLSIELLKAKNIPIQLLVFNGSNPSSEEIILKLSGIKNYFQIDEVETIDVDFIQSQARRILPFLIK